MQLTGLAQKALFDPKGQHPAVSIWGPIMSITATRAAMMSYAGETLLRNDDVDVWPEGTTGTGLDRLIQLLVTDEGLLNRIPTSEIAEAARAADGINTLIIDAIRATGVGNNTTISVSDLRDMSDYIRADADRYARFVELHGDDEDGIETGFHLAQNDGSTGRLFDRATVDTVMDGIYHLGFEIVGGNTTNEDGNRNAALVDLADWLTDLLADDLQAGALTNPDVDGYAQGTTGTGLDTLVKIIAQDEGLNSKIATSDITMGAEAANQMNHILIEAIKETGVANDGSLTLEDLRDVSAWIYRNRGDDWIALHGDDEDGIETGFHLVQGDGGSSVLYDENAVNTVADGIYHIGFMIQNDRFVNEDGNANAKVATVLDWLNDLLRDDFATGTLAGDTAALEAMQVTREAADSDAPQASGRDDVLTDGAEVVLPQAVYALDAPLVLDGERGSYLDLTDPNGDLALANGTFAMIFTPTTVDGTQALFAKDLTGRSGSGEFTVWLQDGKIKVTQDDGDTTHYFRTSDVVITAGTPHSVAYSFGADGMQLFVDGERVLLDTEWNEGVAAVDANLTLGASRVYWDAASDARYEFTGTISDFVAYDSQLSADQVQKLAAAGGVALADAGANAIVLSAFAQMDAGSDLLADLAATFNVSTDGVLTVDGSKITGGIGDDVSTGTDLGDILTGDLGADELIGGAGDDALLGGAGADLLLGGDGNDILDGGAGEDVVSGGAGDDLIISRSDGREPVPAQDATAQVYAGQPVAADDTFHGGAGADIFYFQTLMNADSATLGYRANDMGDINWRSVGYDNSSVHAHWVESIGNDVILDFSFAEGDQLIIEGHATKIKSVTYGDANDDGVMDHSIVELYAWNWGDSAHQDDSLGTITVFGDLIAKSDIIIDDDPDYGIVDTLTDAELATAPLVDEGDTGPIAAPNNLSVGPIIFETYGLDPVFNIAGHQVFDRDEKRFLDFGNPDGLDLESGTVTANFTLGEDHALSSSRQVIFSKDANDHDGGHVMMYVRSGRLFVEIEKDSGTKTLTSGEITLEAGQAYDVAFSFGADGAHLYLNGTKIDNDPYLTVDWTENDADLIVGASGQWRSASNPTGTWDQFDGEIRDFAIHDRALSVEEIMAITTTDPLPGLQLGDAAVALGGQPNVAAGTGLTGEIFDMDSGLHSVADLEARIAEMDRSHAFTAVNIDFGNRDGDDTVDGFLGAGAERTEGDGTTAMETIGMQLTGFIYIPAGAHQVTVRSDDGYVLRLGGELFSSHQDDRSFHATSRTADFGEGGLFEFEISYYENWGSEGLRLEIDGETVGAEQFFASVEDYQTAIDTYGIVDPAQDDTGVALAAPDMPAVYDGTGLTADIFNADSGWGRISELVDQIEGGTLTATHAADVKIVDFGDRNQDSTIANFFGENATLTAGDGGETMTYVGVKLTGYIYIPEGEHRITVRSDDGFLLRLGGEDFSSYSDPRSAAATHQTADFGGGLYPIELYYYENGGAESLRLELDGEVVDAAHFYASVEDFQTALAENGPMPEGGLPPRPEDVIATTGTGLDAVVAKILADPGLDANIPDTDIADGARAANAMNQILIDAIKETGVANDGKIDASDMYDVSEWIRANRYDDWVALHGDDENGVETGFHLVQNDGANGRMFAENAVNTIADGLYHAGFDIQNGRFLNEDGNQNAQVEDVAWWISELLARDLADGSLANPDVAPESAGTTGTGLDSIVTLIYEDSELQRRVSNADLREGADAADTINTLIIDAIRATGAANDGKISIADIYAINAYIRSDADRYAEFMAAHGDDEGNIETGYHSVQDDGAITRLFAENAVNTVVDGIYHIGFEIKDGRLLNEDGNANARLEDVAYWLDSLLARDMRGTDGPAEPAIMSPINSLANESVAFYTAGTTGTGLDKLVEIINRDQGLEQRISHDDQMGGAEAANALNALIIDGIKATGVANDGTISAGDIYLLTDYIQSDEARYQRFVELHGDDENGVETGFHLVQNDGAYTRLFARNAVDTIADGIYHIGFGMANGRLINEDGNANARIEEVADWLNTLLSDDLEAGDLANDSVDPLVTGDTGTGLDQIADIINADSELNRRISTADIMGGAAAANGISAMIVEAIQELGLGNDGTITSSDVYDINAYIRENHYEDFVALHGDDENGEETGYHLVQDDGAISRLFGDNAIDTVADGIFHIGFEIENGRFLNEDGNANARVEQVAEWLSQLLEDDLALAAATPTDGGAVDAVRQTLSDALGGEAGDYVPNAEAVTENGAITQPEDGTEGGGAPMTDVDMSVYDSADVYNGDDGDTGFDLDADDAQQLGDIFDDTTS